MSDNKGRRSLKNLWLNPDYQRRYIFWATFMGFLMIVMNELVFYFFTRENYALLVDLSPMTAEAKELLYHELWLILMFLAGAGLFCLLLASLLGLIFSHLTVGPMYHFKKVFAQIENGDRSARVHLRPGDDFKDVANSFNQMMDSISPPQNQNTKR